MTDAQLTIALGAFAGVASAAGFVVRWAVNVITEAIKANTASNIELAKKSTELSTKIDGLSVFVQEHTPVNQPIPKPPRKTPAGGYSFGRGGTSGDE